MMSLFGDAGSLVDDFLKKMKPSSATDVATAANPLLYLGNKAREGDLTPAVGDAGKAVVGSFLNLMGAGVKHVTRPAGGYLAEHNIDPGSLLPVPRDSSGNVTLGSVAQAFQPVVYDHGHLQANPTFFLPPQVRNALGGLLAQVPGGESVTHATNLPEGQLAPQLNIAQQQAVKNAPSKTSAFKQAMANDPLGKLAFETIYDPFTLLSIAAGGLPEAGTAAAADASKLGQLGDFLNYAIKQANEGYNTVAGAPIKGAVKAVEIPLRASGLLDKAPEGKAAQLLFQFLRAVEERQNPLRLPGSEAPPTTPVEDILPKGPTNGTEATTQAADNLVTSDGKAEATQLGLPLNGTESAPVTPATQTTTNQQVGHLFTDANGVGVQVPLTHEPPTAHEILHSPLNDAQQQQVIERMRGSFPSIFPPEVTPEIATSTPEYQSKLLSDLRVGEKNTRVVGKNVSNFENGTFTNGVPRFLTAEEIAARDGDHITLNPAGNIDVNDPANQPVIQKALQQFTDTPANDPRWRYVHPGTRVLFGKESVQPSLLRSTNALNFTNDLHSAIRDVTQASPKASSGSFSHGSERFLNSILGSIHPYFQRFIEPSQKWFGVPAEALPKPLNDVADQFSKEADAAYQEVQAMPGMAKFRGEAQKAEQAIGLILDNAAQHDPTILDPSNTSAQVVGKLNTLFAQGKITKEEVGNAEELIKNWGVPGTAESQGKYFVNQANAAMEAIQKKYDPHGYETDALQKKYRWLMSAYKETKLMTPRNLLQNRIDMTVKTVQALAKDGQWERIPEVLKNAVTFRNPTSVMDLLSPFGENAKTQLVAGKFVRAHVANLPQEFEAGATPFTRMSASDNPAVAAVGKTLDPVAKARRELELAQETSFRSYAYASGYLKNIEDKALPDFTRELETRLADAGVARSEIDSIFADLHIPEGGKFSSQDVLDVMHEHLPDQQQLANSLALRWQRYTNEAVNAGIERANQVHFDYTDIRNVDKFLNKFTLFHFWATRNLPYYANTFAENPFLMRFMLDYVNLSNDQRKEFGYTSRTQNKVLGITIPGIISQTMVGEGALALFDPLVAISVYDQSRGGLSSLQGAGSPLQKAYSAAQIGGIVPSPIITEFMNAMGAFGTQEPQNLFTQSNLLHDVAQNIPVVQNIRPEYWLRQGVVNTRAALTGKPAPQYVSDSAYKDYAINKKIRELGYQMTGKVYDSRFEEAMSDPTSPIYQYAKKLVDRQGIVQDIYSLFSPVPMTIVPQTEQTARAAQASEPKGSLSDATLQTLRQENNPAALYWSIPQGKQETQIRSAQALIREVGPIYEKDPTFMAQLYAHFPAYQQYRAWAASQPQSSNKTVNAFLGNLATENDINTITSTARSQGWDNQALNYWLTQQGFNSIQDVPHDQVRYLLEALRQSGAPPTSPAIP